MIRAKSRFGHRNSTNITTTSAPLDPETSALTNGIIAIMNHTTLDISNGRVKFLSKLWNSFSY